MKKNYSKIKARIFLIVLIIASAFELIILQNKIIKVSALVEPIAFIGPDADFGVVFSGELLNKDFFVKAIEEYDASIAYSLKTQVKPRQSADSEYCIANPSDYAKCYPLLCAYLSILSSDNEGDAKDSAALYPPSDILDSWKVVLDTPPIKDQAAQGYEGEPIDSSDTYGCDIRLVLGEISDGGGSSGEEDPPVIKAKWEMNAAKDNITYLGTDDGEEAGAQFMPSGQYEVDKNYAVCAIVTDSHVLADINGVYANTLYPADISTGPNHAPDRLGCGQSMGEVSLNKLPKMEGIKLFCDRIQNNNNNLPVFNASPIAYNYDEICRLDGELWKETAAVYCGESVLSYEDPAGEYEISVSADDKEGITGVLKNKFAYLPLTSFETDFTDIDYGKVKLNTQKILAGNLTFQENDGKPSIRNTGNTRFNIVVWEDDMDLGKTDLGWNVKYGARIGSEAIFAIYYPEASTAISDSLNLSETNEMDFSVEVVKFKLDADSYGGEMSLNALAVPQLTCQ